MVWRTSSIIGLSLQHQVPYKFGFKVCEPSKDVPCYEYESLENLTLLLHDWDIENVFCQHITQMCQPTYSGGALYIMFENTCVHDPS